MTSLPLGVALLLVSLTAPLAARAEELPRAHGFVNDFAGVLDADGRTEIESLLRETEQNTSAEIALAVVPSLDGRTVEDYANALFNEWGVGKHGKDNGVLVLVAPTERKIRIEVGYGLEPILPDGLAGEIIRTDFLPGFRSGRFQSGIIAGVRHIAAIVVANHTLTSEERGRLTEGDRPPALLMVPFFGLFVALGALGVGLGVRTRSVFPLIWGGIFGGVPFLMSLVPFFNASIWILGPLALVMAVVGYAKGGSPSWLESARGTSNGRRGRGGDAGGWVMGAGTSSSGGGSGSSGGGFGGGSSGGGGASGSW